MPFKWFGALLILGSSIIFGCSISVTYRKNIRQFRQFIHAVSFMECQLQYRLTPLPELCCQTAKETGGSLGLFFQNLAHALNNQSAPEVSWCTSSALKETSNLSPCLKRYILRLGHTLGRFDLPGQLKGLRSIKNMCREDLSRLEQERNLYQKSYQTLCLCTGAALVILFL